MRLLVLAALCLEAALAAKILAFIPFPMKSHHIAFQPIVRELADRGHQVTYLTAVPMDQPVPPNLTQVLVPNALKTVQNEVLPGFVEFGRMSSPVMSSYFSRVGQTIIDTTMSTSQAQEIIHSNEKYDLVIHEAFFVSEPVVALQHKFNAPGVALMPLADSAWLNEMCGLTDNPSYMIDFKTVFTDQLSFVERLRNLYHLVATLGVSYFNLRQMQVLMDKHFNYAGWEGRPPIAELLADQALVLVNSHHSVGYSFPKAPHVKEVGGINLQPQKPLPKDIEKMLDESPQGVIYFSLGSNINMSEVSSNGIRSAFANVFAQLKQKVLWKWTGKDFPSVPENVLMSDWFPQQDILAHKNVKLFITHGGLLSTIEAAHSAVPLIGIPFFADQRKNLQQITRAGFGLGLDFDNLTESSISWAVNEVLREPKYKRQAEKHQQLFRDRPMKPLDEAIYWIEYVLKHGKVLQPESVRMPFYKLHNLDVLAVCFLLLAACFCITKTLACWVIKKFLPTKQEKYKKL